MTTALPRIDDRTRSFADLARQVLLRPPALGETRFVCVDGPAGSGKTRFAERLALALGDAPVVHMDDVYEGWDVDLGEPLAQRLTELVLQPVAAGRAATFNAHDWTGAGGVRTVVVPPADAVVLEGVGAGSARLRRRAVLLVWVEAPDPARLDRVVARDGPAVAAEMTRWQRRERAHFAADGTRAAADVLVDGAPVIRHDPETSFVPLPA